MDCKKGFLPGAFTETLKNDDVRALVDHDTGRVIGQDQIGNLGTLGEQPRTQGADRTS